MDSMRKDLTYEDIHRKIVVVENDADLGLDPPTSNRKKDIFSKLKDHVTESTVGAMEGGEIFNVIEYWRASVLYRIPDSILGFLKTKFSNRSLVIANAVDQLLKLVSDGL